MNNKKQSVIWIIVCIVLFLLGLWFGSMRHNQNKTQTQKLQAATSLSSKVISSITAYGQVTSIQGDTITLNNLGDNLPIIITSNARIFSFTAPSKGSPAQQTASFSNIKVGNNVNVVMNLSSDGQMQGTSVIILPQTK